MTIKMPSGDDFAAEDIPKHAITVIGRMPDDARLRILTDLARMFPQIFALLVNEHIEAEIARIEGQLVE